MKSLLGLLFVFSAVAGAEVKMISIEALTEGKLSLRQTWDQTQQFCFKTKEVEKTCYKITGVGEIKLRENGQWTGAAAAYSFSDSVKSGGEKYDRIFLRYLSLGGSGEFLVHIFYVPVGGSMKMGQTIFAVGNQASGEIQQMSFSNGMELLGAMFGAMAVTKSDKEEVLNKWMVDQHMNLLNVAQSVVRSQLGVVVVPGLP